MKHIAFHAAALSCTFYFRLFLLRRSSSLYITITTINTPAKAQGIQVCPCKSIFFSLLLK